MQKRKKRKKRQESRGKMVVSQSLRFRHKKETPQATLPTEFRDLLSIEP